MPEGLPAEVLHVPADVDLVAYADIKTVMGSELHRRLMPSIEGGERKGPKMMSEFAGIDLEKQVDHIVAYIERAPAAAEPGSHQGMPRALLLVQGTFDQAAIERLVKEKGGTFEDYKGRKRFVHRDAPEEIAIGFARPDLIALGLADLVRRALDRSADAAPDSPNVTSNAEIMSLIRASAGSTAWVVGRFDAVSRRLPSEVSSQVPTLRYVSAKASINGGVKATVRADTADKAAADQLRDVVRGFVAMARLSAGTKPQFEQALKSIEVSGTDTSVQMSFAVAADTLAALAPRRRK